MFALGTLPLLLLLLATSATAQILEYGNGQLPACAQGCTPLIQAQAVCVPVPSTQKSCFCQSAYLTQQTGNLFNDPNAVCTQVCPSQSDRAQIQSWYKNYCNGGSGTSQQTPASSPGATSTAGAPTSTASTSGNNQPFQIQQDEQPSWWSQHGKWIAMVIVLVIAFTAIIILGVWWKRRHDRKVNQATAEPLPDGWGPPSDPHTYAAAGGEKKRSNVSSRPSQQPHDVEMGKGRKLKKFLGR